MPVQWEIIAKGDAIVSSAPNTGIETIEIENVECKVV
jgi:hypothetical protein